MADPQSAKTVFDWLNPVVAALSGITGVAVGGLIFYFREKATRKYSFFEQKAKEFYAPIVGMRQEILAKSKLRVKLRGLGAEGWAELTERTKDLPPHEQQKIDLERWPEYERLLETGDEEFLKEMLPLYNKMLDLFREKQLYINKSTNDHYYSLLEFVFIWNYYNKKVLPREVIKKLDHSEKPLEPFYDNINKTLESIQSKLTKG